ncbi:hypothetical protein D9756_006226 [Leucocoprinus leucothites]|uniref:Amidohydrolase-related domain-containing protein n=1 Tax=Leucocoprinus leucothites TaxID=201217 RepID=A0A8H5FWY6_9AGAR|nr:hypothetical protein D9756_006226 [Leucoagaricus leucothites]
MESIQIRSMLQIATKALRLVESLLLPSFTVHNMRGMVASHSATRGGTVGKGKIYGIFAGKLFDPIKRRMRDDQVIMIDRELGVIVDVMNLDEFRRSENKDVEEFYDFGKWTLVPGFVDVHVHMFLHAYSNTPWNDQVTKESLAERTIRATVHAQKTLMAGFTTVRDLGTEGALDADISLRKCLSGKEPIVQGPRYYCANRAIVTTGSYGPRSSLFPSRGGVEGVLGAEVADGVDGCVREVRRQIGVGADWIKIYADYRVRTQMGDVSSSLGSRSTPTFNRQELEAMITTAHCLGVKVAAHANTAAAIDNLLDVGVDSIEHGPEMYDSESPDSSIIRKLAAANGTTKWVPTLAAYHTLQTRKAQGRSLWERARDTFVKAVIEEGLENVACGGDTGVFDHGENAKELVLMRQLGASWEKVLSWATIGGWECIRGFEWEGELGRKRVRDLEENPGAALDGTDRGVPFGAIIRGWAADLVGIEGDLTGSPNDFEKAVTEGVKLVIKDGKIVKRVE